MDRYADVAPVISIQEAIERHQQLAKYVSSVIIEGHDFGPIPGSDKPSLKKPGAEKLTTYFGLTKRLFIVEKIEDWTGEHHGGEPFFYYLYRCALYRGDLLIAEADGSCNSRETKYRWREMQRTCPTCNSIAIIRGKEEYGGGWICFQKKGGCGAKFEIDDPVITSQQVGRVANADIADQVVGVDAVLGDHNDIQVDGVRSNGVLVTENRGKGIRFTRVRLVFDPATKQVVYKTADFHKPWTIGVTPDPAIQAKIDGLNAQLAPVFNTVLGVSTVFIPRADACGRADGRLCESRVGNVATDAMRTIYGADFALTNAGGLRADLTCPTTDLANDNCPAYTPPPYPITRGQALAVLPFGNLVATATITGAELKDMLEHSVSSMPAANGRFGQVSGLCFTYDVSKPARTTAGTGSRVQSVVRQAANGSCTATPVDLTPLSSYTLATNDFVASGGDGYPSLAGRFATQDFMDEVVADYVEANTPISPAIQGRIVCTTSGAAVCPIVTP